MRNQKQFLIGIILPALVAGLAIAEKSSVEGVLAELDQAISSKPVQKESLPVVEAVTSEEVVAEISSVEASPSPSVKMVKTKRKWASTLERERRNAEEAAIKTVECSWNGMVFRDYPLSSDAVSALNASDATEAVDVRSEFPEVKFPKGSYAVYRPALKHLFVQNTRSNMQRFEAVMGALKESRRSESDQVEIKARFVEFSEGALEELGFEWSTPDVIDLGSDWAVNDATALSSLDARQTLFGAALRSVPYARPLSDLAAAANWSQVPIAGNWAVNRIEDSLGTTAASMNLAMDFGDRLDLAINAMDQSSGVDVLSSPSIVVLSGEEATITVGESHNYPTGYEEGSSIGTVLYVSYEDFEEKMLGIEMTVSPLVEGEQIRLELNPKIIDLIGWEQFELAPQDSCYNYYQNYMGNTYEHDPVIANLPVFKRREIKTGVSIASGSTIGLGGLIGEKTEAFDDRVPVLGSIPLIGRLFRSEGERTVKRNLMIFVTATKVAPNGRLLAGRSFE